jgi:hypothetical protein
VEGDASQFVRNDSRAAESLFCGSGRLNTSMTVTFGSSNATMSLIVGSGSFLRDVCNPCAAVYFSNASRSSSGLSWNPIRVHCGCESRRRITE